MSDKVVSVWSKPGSGLGIMQLPLLPQYMVLVDRADGSLWTLTHSITPPASDGFGYISITSGKPDFDGYYFFDVGREPVLAVNPTVRIIIRDGYLGYTTDEPLRGIQTDRDQARIMTRRSTFDETREIIRPTGWIEGTALAWSPTET